MDNKSVLVVMDIQQGFLGENPKLPIKKGDLGDVVEFVE